MRPTRPTGSWWRRRRSTRTLALMTSALKPLALKPSAPMSRAARRSPSSRPLDRSGLEQQEMLERDRQPIGLGRYLADGAAAPDVDNAVATLTQPAQLDRAVPAIGIECVVASAIFGDRVGFGLVEADIIELAPIASLRQPLV